MKKRDEKIYTCIKCSAQIEKNSKQCPHCGRKYPRVPLILLVCLILCIFLLVGLGITTIFTNTEQSATTTHNERVVSNVDSYIANLITTELIKDSVITATHDTSNATRSRMQVWAYSTQAKSDREFLAAAATIATEYQHKDRAQLVSVIMHSTEESAIQHNIPILVLDYSIDRKGPGGEKDQGSHYKLEQYYGEDAEISALKYR